MQAGDLVKLLGSFRNLDDDGDELAAIGCGVLISYAPEVAEDWWNILDCDGEMVQWPESQLQKVAS